MVRDLRSSRIHRDRCFFFFQAEDGIRDLTVTGVQTCALPILLDADRGGPRDSRPRLRLRLADPVDARGDARSEEHTSELQSQSNLVCRLLLEKKKKYSRAVVVRSCTHLYC